MRHQVTINDVARAAGVSLSSVSLALNDRPGLSPSTRERILTVASELGWTPKAAARSLSSGRSQTIALILARPAGLLAADPFFAPFISGVEAALEPTGYGLLLQIASSATAEQDRYRQGAAAGRFDGALLLDLRVDDPRPKLLDELGLFGICVGVPAEPSGCPVIVPDEEAGLHAAMGHLAELGHRHIGYVAGPAQYVHSNRRRVIVETACRDFGIQTTVATGDFSATSGASAATSLMLLDPAPTAIVFANDLMAAGGMKSLLARGYRIPEDVSIIGYDDSDFGEHLPAPLTTVRTDTMSWGRAAAEALLTLISGTPVSDRLLPAPELVVRTSTGRPARSEPIKEEL